MSRRGQRGDPRRTASIDQRGDRLFRPAFEDLRQDRLDARLPSARTGSTAPAMLRLPQCFRQYAYICRVIIF